jgi:vancomycin aglycone glucosyltransferase
MRVVLVAFGTLGDVQPLVVLGAALRRAGHRVLLCSRPEIAEWLDLRGLDLFPIASPPPRPRWAWPRRPAPWFVRLRRYARAEAGAQFDALSAAARGADLLLSAGSQLVVAAVAEALGIRHRSFVFCPQMLPSRRHPPFAVPWPRAPRWLRRAGRRFHVELYNRAIHPAAAACRSRAGLGPPRDEFAANFLTHPIVACDPELAPVPADCELAADQVGYLHPDDPPGALPAELERFLAAGPPPVYIGFGSATPGPAVALTRSIVAAVAAAGCRAVVARGAVGLGEGEGGAGGGRIRFIGPLPHRALFGRVAAVVHHGGAGTTATAARAGRPQVILPPSLYDQAYWRQQIVERGLGVWAPRPQRLMAARLARALAQVLGDLAMAERAAALGEVLRRRDAVRDTVALLEADA